MRLRLLVPVAILLIPVYTQAEPNFARFRIDQDGLSGAPDFSYLNHPLGPADRIFVRDGHFYRVGPDLKPNTKDDERVRFFGVTLIFNEGVLAPADAPRLAKRLRRLGFNIVRYPIGHILTKAPLPTFDPGAIERVRYLLKSLKAEGIYLDLIVDGAGFLFRPAIDKVPSLPGGSTELPADAKLYMFYPRMVELQSELSRRSIGVLELKGEPQLAMVELRNEGSLLRAWETGHVDQHLAGEYRDELRRQWDVFLKTKYASTAALKATWGKLAEGERLEDASVAIVESKATSRTATARVNDYLLFLVDRDRAYLRANLRAVREVTDPLVPVSGTQMNYGGGLLNADSHDEMDYRDNHFYVDHPEFKDLRDWRMRNASSLGTGLQTILNIAAARVAGFP